MIISLCELNFNITDKNVSAENHRKTLKLIDDQNSGFLCTSSNFILYFIFAD